MYASERRAYRLLYEKERKEEKLRQEVKHFADLKKTYQKKECELQGNKESLDYWKNELEKYNEQYTQKHHNDHRVSDLLSKCFTKIEECKEQISKFNSEVTKNEKDLQNIIRKISRSKATIQHTINDLRNLKKSLDEEKEKLKAQSHFWEIILLSGYGILFLGESAG